MQVGIAVMPETIPVLSISCEGVPRVDEVVLLQLAGDAEPLDYRIVRVVWGLKDASTERPYLSPTAVVARPW